MANYFTRTFEYTIATLGEVTEDKNGNPVVTKIGEFTVDGEADKAKALKAAKKTGKFPESLVVIKVESKKELRGMTVEKFLESSLIMADARNPVVSVDPAAPAESVPETESKK